MKKTVHIAIIAVLALVSGACGSSVRYTYVEDAPRDTEMPINQDFAPVLKVGDRVYVFVYSQNDIAVRPFNEETNKEYNASNAEKRGYLIDARGDIVFPVVGRVHADGLTLDELERSLEGRLKEGRYLKDPIVTVSMMNFGVTVIGEVTEPKVVYCDGTRLTIFEAIAQCGDITMYGMRSNVVVVRGQGEDRVVDTVDLTTKQVLESPYYYLRSGDIIYVEPTKKKQRLAYRNEDWPHYMTTGIAALRTAYSIIYRVIRMSNMN